MRIDRVAHAIDSRYISRTLSLASCAELCTTCADCAPTGLSSGKYALPCRTVAAGLDPVVHEGALHLRHGGTFELEVRIAPVIGILAITRPLVGDPDAAGEADPAVDHQQLAMGTVVHPGQRVPAQRMVLHHLDAGVDHLVDAGLIHLAAADPVENQVDRNSGTRALGRAHR